MSKRLEEHSSYIGQLIKRQEEHSERINELMKRQDQGTKRKAVISPFVDPRARPIAERLNIEVYTSGYDVKI